MNKIIKKPASKTIVSSPAVATTPTPAPEQIDCRIWRAWKGTDFYERKPIDGLLLTEPNNLDAPIAYLKIAPDSGMPTLEAAVRRAADIFADPSAIDWDDTPMDLRSLCRWWSTQATPEWLYEITVEPAEGMLGRMSRWAIDYKPLCTLRMGVLVDQYLRQRFPYEDQEKHKYTSVGMYTERDEDYGRGMGDCVDGVIWRGSDPHEIAEVWIKAISDAKTEAKKNGLQAIPQLTPGR